MKFRIAIPTISRAHVIEKKTISYLKKTDIDFNKVDIFLGNKNELDEYKNALKNYAVNLYVSNTNHVNTQRNFIVRHYKEGTHVLGIDDDIDNVEYKIDDKNTATLIDLVKFSEQAFDLCSKYKIDMWGINPVLNPYFMKNKVSFDLRYIPAGFYGWRNTYHEKAFVSENPEYGKEDFERSIRYYIADNGVIRFNYVAPRTKYYSTSGGIQNYRTLESEETAVEWLLKTFSSFCKRKIGGKNKFPEVKLRDRRKKRIK